MVEISGQVPTQGKVIGTEGECSVAESKVRHPWCVLLFEGLSVVLFEATRTSKIPSLVELYLVFSLSCSPVVSEGEGVAVVALADTSWFKLVVEIMKVSAIKAHSSNFSNIISISPLRLLRTRVVNTDKIEFYKIHSTNQLKLDAV